MRAYSQDLRDRVIGAYEKNIAVCRIVKLFNICRTTVDRWINKYIDTGDYSSKQGHSGQPPYKFNDKQAILDFIAKNPDADGIAIRNTVAPSLPMSTFYDTLARMEITYKKKSQNTKNVRNMNASHSLKK